MVGDHAGVLPSPGADHRDRDRFFDRPSLDRANAFNGTAPFLPEPDPVEDRPQDAIAEQEVIAQRQRAAGQHGVVVAGDRIEGEPARWV